MNANFKSLLEVVIFSMGLFLALMSFPLPATNLTSQPEYTLGVFPYLPPSGIQKRYLPVATDLSQFLQIPVRLKTRDTFRNFQIAISQEEFDIIFIQPFDFVRTAVPHGYTAIARPKGQLSAVFVIRPDSSIKNVSELKGKIIAMPPRDAAVSLLGEKVLFDSGLNLKSDVKINYQSNHFGCMKQLIIKKVDACVTAAVPKKLFEHRSGVTLKVLKISEPIPTSLFAVHSRVPNNAINAITARMLDWKNSNEGRVILNDLQFEAVIEASDSNYDVVRKILNTIKYL